MSQVLYGPRLGREGQLRVGCSAVIFDETRTKVLLTQRQDNGLWCLPGGHMESGESAAEACEREVWEETGLKVRATRLLGVYSNPDQLVIYKDGNKAFFVVLNFEVEVLEGEVGLSDETTAFGWFTLKDMESMQIHANHKLRVEDALRGGDAAMR
ncbi:MAG TPA: NUDIX domain-containing protein [Anaerolineales bacterium]|nr:NUDIX domain-containing protein [Anaerolineales bacterium]HNN14598.1 NUDIX domain-containing protein [Anaerolineales bacterium]HNO30646.1 NUDIX domain-containing protein [Anaerolineales bacterium]